MMRRVDSHRSRDRGRRHDIASAIRPSPLAARFASWALVAMGGGLAAIAAPANPTTGEDRWEPLRWFVGTWEGTGTGPGGASSVERSYELVLGDRFLFTKNRSVFEPKEGEPAGETHEDWGLFSIDDNRDAVVLRQFHVEGFVNRYVLEDRSEDRKTLTFTTEEIENFQPGWRARITLRLVDEDTFEERFWLEPPEGSFQCHVTNTLHRAAS